MTSSDTEVVEGVEKCKVFGRNANKLKMDKETPGRLLT